MSANARELRVMVPVTMAEALDRVAASELCTISVIVRQTLNARLVADGLLPNNDPRAPREREDSQHGVAA